MPILFNQTFDIFMQALGHCLIMWDSVEPSLEWIKASHLPPVSIHSEDKIFVVEQYLVISWIIFSWLLLALQVKVGKVGRFICG